MRRPAGRPSRRRMLILTGLVITVIMGAGPPDTGQHAGGGQPPGQPSPPAPALAKLHCTVFRASQQVEIHGTLAAPQPGTYTAVAQLITPHGQPTFPEPVRLGTLIWPQPRDFLVTSPQRTAGPSGGTWTVIVTLSQGHTTLGSHTATVRCPRF
jgi:hypothetical protein